jgi:hypothetical protein
MKIKKFCHVDNGKTVYAVIGESDRFNALKEVCQYKKANSIDFYNTHNIYTGLIKNKKLYRIDIDVNDSFGAGIEPCYIIARDTIDIDKYIQIAS